MELHGNDAPRTSASREVAPSVAEPDRVGESLGGRAALQNFLSLVDESTDFIGMCDMSFQPFYVNAAGLRLVGLDTRERALATPVKEFFFPEDQQFV